MRHWLHLALSISAIGLLLTFYPSLAQSTNTPSITLTDDIPSIRINDFLEFAADEEKQLTIEKLTASPKQFDSRFKPITEETRSQSRYWLRFRVDKQSKLNNYFTFKDNEPSDIQLYVTSDRSSDSSNDSNSLTYRTISPLPRQIMPSYPLLNFDNEQIQTYYLRISSSYLKDIPVMHIHSSTQLLTASNLYISFYALIMGAMLIVSIYNLILFLSLKDPIYSILAVAIFSQTFLLANTNGIYQLLTNSGNTIDFNLYNAMYLITIISSLDYLRRVIDAKVYAPLFNKIFLGIAVIGLFSLLFFPYLEKASKLISFFVLTMMPITFISVIIAKSNGQRFATSLILVIPVYIVTVSPYLLAIFGFLDNTDFYMRVMHIGLLSGSILLSLTLAEKTREIQESRKLAQDANEAKGKLLANMSHELRTPMNATIGLSELLKQTPLNEQQRDYVNKLLTSSRHMLHLINKLLDFSKIKADKFVLSPHDFSLNTLLDTVCIQVEGACKHKNIAFNLNIDPECPKHFYADQTGLSQVLINLTNNAVKFTHQGSVSLALKLIEQTDEQALVNFRVTDTGLGMTLQEQQSIFEPFAMGNMKYSRNHAGTGLGLTISQDILKLMGSHIEVNSTPNKGSTFSFSVWLPICESTPSMATTQDTHTPLRPTPVLLGKKIMVVDDDPLNRMVAHDLLNTLGVTVVLVESGKHILDQLASDEPELIFMDLQMPDLDGYETMKLLQEDGRFKHIPVVALTAHASSEDENRCIQSGMIGFVTKPFELDEIKHILLSLLTMPNHIPQSASETPAQQQNDRITATYQKAVENTQSKPSEHFLQTTLLYLEESSEELLSYLENQEWEKSAKCAHRLKGSCHLYAPPKLVDLLKVINDNDFPRNEATKIKEDLNQELRSVMAEIRQTLANKE